jgi:hypothetical protein
MRAPTHLPALFAVALLAACCASCARPPANPIKMTEAHSLRVERAASEFHARMNAGEYGAIWDDRLPHGLYNDRESFTNYVAWIQQKYGPVKQSRLLKGEVRPHSQEPGKFVADCWFEVEAAQGKYVEWVVWHFADDEDQLALHKLTEYDAEGRPYMTLTLQTGLGPNDVQTRKIPLGGDGRPNK